MGIAKRIKEFFTGRPTVQYNIRQQVAKDIEENNKVLDRIAAAKAAHPAGKGKTYVAPVKRATSTPSRVKRERDKGYDYEPVAFLDEPSSYVEETRGSYDAPTVCQDDRTTFSTPSYETPSFTTPSYDPPSSSSSSSTYDSGGGGE